MTLRVDKRTKRHPGSVLKTIDISYSSKPGAIIRDGDSNEISFFLVGLSPCVIPKNLFLEKIAPYARARTSVNGQDRAWRN